MKIDLSGKNIVVTGGARGLGRACVQAFTESGARVALVDIDFKTAKESAARYRGAAAYACDLEDPASLKVLHQKLSDDFDGRIDILVNNAGIISYAKDFESISVGEWDQVININLRGPFLASQVFGVDMKAQRSGKIINVSSLAAHIGGIDVGVHYTTSKAGIIGLTRSFARKLGPFGINVNAVAPGITLTGPVKRHLAGREDEYVAAIPLRRLGTPQDVAQAVLFLSCPMSDYITGCVLDVNGGMYMN
ncbi:MAG: SDR family oxidoreductase [bacterium]|nr:SDR family oxidoreductase [bacterium]